MEKPVIRVKDCYFFGRNEVMHCTLVDDHPNFPAGTHIKPSKIVERKGNRVETQNTIYEIVDE